jgi:probable phosphoglycerate mutase
MVGSWTDWDLTELGKIQAEHIGKKLNDELAGKKVSLYSSDLKRAMQTAEEIAKYLGVEPIFRQELRETNLGKCCGKSVQWLRENIECPENTVDDRLFSDGESRRDKTRSCCIRFGCLLGKAGGYEARTSLCILNHDFCL